MKVEPETKTVQVCLLQNGQYIIKVYGDQEEVPVAVLNDFSVDMRKVFPEPE